MIYKNKNVLTDVTVKIACHNAIKERHTGHLNNCYLESSRKYVFMISFSFSPFPSYFILFFFSVFFFFFLVFVNFKKFRDDRCYFVVLLQLMTSIYAGNIFLRNCPFCHLKKIITNTGKQISKGDNFCCLFLTFKSLLSSHSRDRENVMKNE